MQDAVDCPEVIVPINIFKSLAEKYDFELVFVKNNHEFVHENIKKPEYVDLMQRLGALGDGNQDLSSIEATQVSSITKSSSKISSYQRGQPNRTPVKSRRDKGKMHLEKEAILYISTEV
ncbi:mRNA cap guanine-N7 methyltransferase 1 [Populus alba x Populus x berolinensis]|nr:mRNA cap guanine-N7 methyltransferase 1 [Populus alba x Populus x berolinensis]